MIKDFRSEVFSLCKILSKDANAIKISDLIHDLSVSTESVKTGTFTKNKHGDFAYVAKHYNKEFHSFLFVDDNIDNINLPQFLSLEHLSDDERLLCEQGHVTLHRFVELCLDDLSKMLPNISNAINPYTFYLDVKIKNEVQQLISDDEMKNVCAAFKKGEVYQTLVKSDISELLNTIKKNEMMTLIQAIEKEFDASISGEFSKDLRDFSLKITDDFRNINDILFAATILIYSLRESLKIACKLLYKSICGSELFVLNNDNIISIENVSSNLATNFYKVFAQELFLDHTGTAVGNIILIDCDPSDDNHIHEFGFVVKETMNLSSEYGQTAKYSFITLDNQLVPIHRLTNDIIKKGFPKIVKK